MSEALRGGLCTPGPRGWGGGSSSRWDRRSGSLLSEPLADPPLTEPLGRGPRDVQVLYIMLHESQQLQNILFFFFWLKSPTSEKAHARSCQFGVTFSLSLASKARGGGVGDTGDPGGAGGCVLACVPGEHAPEARSVLASPALQAGARLCVPGPADHKGSEAHVFLIHLHVAHQNAVL